MIKRFRFNSCETISLSYEIVLVMNSATSFGFIRGGHVNCTILGAMQVDEIDDVDLKLVWDPPWNKDMMSDAAKLELNL